VSAIALVTGMTLALTAGSSGAAQSDSRATEVSGNVTTCAGAGFPDSIQVGSPSNGNASDANVSGVVKTNAGTTNPGQGQEVDVTLLTGSVEIDAVIVKGGPNYNLYTNPTFLPPTLAPDQHYIAPLVGAGNVPTISHWFVCYTLTAPPETGSLRVTKVVGAPDGTPVTPLPTSYTATVTCTDPVDDVSAATNQVSVVTFGAGGGVGVAVPPLDGLDIGTVCTVVEDTTGFDAKTVVTYDPAGANTDGVEIPDSEVGVTVQITNDFSGVPIEVSPADVVNPPVAAAPIAASPAFTG
jgi:hypothetical protein